MEGLRGDTAINPPLEIEAPETVFDYFAGEIFDREDSVVQDLLIKTAFLPFMVPCMATDLTDIPHADRILASLSRRHYFTDKRAHSRRTGQSGSAYRYHPLFRSLLLARAKESFPETLFKHVQRRAASVHGDAGAIEHAVPLLCTLEDWNQLAGVIRAQGARGPRP